MNYEDIKLIPLAAIGVGKGILEVYVVPAIEPYKPTTLEEKIETVGLVIGLGGMAIAAHAIYKELTK